ncbi:MAG: cellulase family glycosylhydrolase [Anaerolineales bacterium]|nr:cellulase family glycosylhydrolase [Anaerolineales bacterium]MCB9128003.1 cellulase family glycosylhydrolase [Ardenticatenales bacterium]
MESSNICSRFSRPTWWLFWLLLTIFALVNTPPIRATFGISPQSQYGFGNEMARQSVSPPLYLPLVANGEPWANPLSAETWGERLNNPTFRERVRELEMRWIRLYGLWWVDVQPEEDGAYHWDNSRTEEFENALIAAQTLGLEPSVIIQHSPRWATIYPTSCAAIRTDKLDDFAQFITAVVERYKEPPFNVHSWELFNEPDVDPGLVGVDSGFGCWGEIGDPYYGGERFGEMLNVVAPAIRAADPQAQIIFGGLLLNTPITTDPDLGHPERFLEGVLLSGAAQSFDILAYHAHNTFYSANANYGGVGYSGAWDDWGGMTKGKPAFLRSVMAQYGVDKPLWMNEGALRCPTHRPYCTGDISVFLNTQSKYLLREIARTMSTGVERFSWYTLHYNGWDQSGLLDTGGEKRPAFKAFEALVQQIQSAAPTPQEIFEYGPNLEAYRFDKPHDPDVDLIFSPEGTGYYASVPVDKFVAAYTIWGEPMPTNPPTGGYYNFWVTYSPLYIHRLP